MWSLNMRVCESIKLIACATLHGHVHGALVQPLVRLQRRMHLSGQKRIDL